MRLAARLTVATLTLAQTDDPDIDEKVDSFEVVADVADGPTTNSNLFEVYQDSNDNDAWKLRFVAGRHRP